MSQAEILDPIKQKHRALWALGDYDVVATDVVSELGRTIVDAAGITPGTRVLDVAAGSGNASLPAAAAGARVVASDLTPELLETGRHRAASQGLDIEWVEADAEHLPFEDGDFDTVLSCVGVMFAPFHQPVADELVRVTRPGGRIALVNWTPTGFVGQMFAVMKPYVATAAARCAAGAIVGYRRPCPHLVRRSRDRFPGPAATAHGRAVRERRELPGLLQEVLRPDHRRLSQHRG